MHESKLVTGAAVLGVLGVAVAEVTVTDRAFEKGVRRLTDDTVYATTDCTPRFGASSCLDPAGHVLTLKMRDGSWDNTWFDGCVVTNGAAAPATIRMDTVCGKFHVRTSKWFGGPENLVDVSRGRFYIRAKVDTPECWSLRLGDETVMGGWDTGTNASPWVWAGPVEFAGRVLFADDAGGTAGGWGCTLTGPLSGPATASVSLARAYCLRLASPTNAFAGSWNLTGGGDGTRRCRLDLLKGAGFSGSRIVVSDSDIGLDPETVFLLPPLRHVSGDCRVTGGARGTVLGSIRKCGAGTLTLDTSAEIRGTVRVEEGTLALGANGRVPRIRRLVCLPGTTLDLNGRDLPVDEVAGTPVVRGGRLVVVRNGATRPPVARGAEVLEELRAIGCSKRFVWAWTEAWTTWGAVNGEDGPRFKTRLGELTGRAPRMMYYDLANVTGTRADDRRFEVSRSEIAEAVRTHWRACRGIPVFSFHMDHPCATNAFPQAWYRYKCRAHPHVIRDILDGTAYPCGEQLQWTKKTRTPYPSPRAWYFRRLDDIAAFFNRLVDDAGDRIPVILRYEHEMDGAWFWWGKGWCTPDEFVRFSRMTADYLRAKCGRENLLFAYTPDRTWKELGAEGDGAASFLSWYAGDAYTDIIGFDDYSIGKGKTPEKAEEAFSETLRKLRLVSAFARERGKVMGITETGCKDANDDFWSRLLKLATADGVDCAFADTWSGSWSCPGTDACREDQRLFVSNPAVLTIPDAQLQRAAAAP